jgi:hypothetical protein
MAKIKHVQVVGIPWIRPATKEELAWIAPAIPDAKKVLEALKVKK